MAQRDQTGSVMPKGSRSAVPWIYGADLRPRWGDQASHYSNPTHRDKVELMFVILLFPAVARRSVVVRAEEAAAAPAKKPEIGPKRGSQVSFEWPTLPVYPAKAGSSAPMVACLRMPHHIRPIGCA